ncbi:MAG TPA: hypothetical protein VJ436_14415 [Anaerolineales bacterium]|nr:hypothetical protein [Anaerolineales bacterium]
MAGGAIIGGGIDAYNQYKETGRIDVGQVAEAALGGAVVGGGLVIGAALVGTAAAAGAAALAGSSTVACADGDCTNEVRAGASGVAKFTETIYRNATGTADSLTPRPGIDDVPGGGLSFYKGLEYLNPGKYVAVDPNKLTNLSAILSPPGHVSVSPATLEKLQEWAATRGTGVVHSLTKEVMNAVTRTGKIE